MKEITQSASKIAFLTLTVTACTGFLLKLLPVDQFMQLALAASVFYFSNKGSAENNYLGK